MKITRLHAKRLAKYLEDELGWEVYPEQKMKCSTGKFHPTGFEDDKFCRLCGAKMILAEGHEDTIGELVKALEKALR